MFLVKWGREERKMQTGEINVRVPRRCGTSQGRSPSPGAPCWFPTEVLFQCSALLISRDKRFLFLGEPFLSRCGYGPGRGRPTSSLPTEEADLGRRDSTHLVHTRNTWNFHSPYPTSPDAWANQNTYSVAKGSHEIISLKGMTEYLEAMGVKLTNMSSLALFVFTFKK